MPRLASNGCARSCWSLFTSAGISLQLVIKAFGVSHAVLAKTKTCASHRAALPCCDTQVFSRILRISTVLEGLLP